MEEKKRRSDYKGPNWRKEYIRQWEEKNQPKILLRAAGQRAKKHGYLFDIEESDVVIPEFCPVLGIRLVKHTGGRPGHFPDSPSLDRVVPEKGYTKGNVRVISARANFIKHNASLQELERVVEDLRRWT